jgi:hypothetical protein
MVQPSMSYYAFWSKTMPVKLLANYKVCLSNLWNFLYQNYKITIFFVQNNQISNVGISDVKPCVAWYNNRDSILL